MIDRIVFGLALMLSAGAASAQDANCTLYKVDTSMLNISKDPGGGIYNDALFDGDVACVTRMANINGIDWGFIAYKLEGTARTPVEGWSSLQYLQQMPSVGGGACGGRRGNLRCARAGRRQCRRTRGWRRRCRRDRA